MVESEHRGVDATVVSVDPSVQPIESVVVADKRDTIGKRLGLLGMIMLLLFFAISGYIQSAKNGRQLNQAANDRSKLIATVNQQNVFIQRLQDAIRDQNKLLTKAGFHTVRIPSPPPGLVTGSSNSQRSQPQPQPEPQSRPTSSAAPSPRPHHSPSPQPTPPLDQVKNNVCSLTGVCLGLTALQLLLML